MKSKLIHILCLCVLLLGFTLKPEQARKPITLKLLTQTTKVVAQDRVQLRFETEAEDLKLLVSNALGSTVLEPETTSTQQSFLIKAPYANASGKLDWKLIHNKNILMQGSLNIKPDTSKIAAIESYLGPQRILAGGADFAQLTLLATDVYDNLLPDATSLTLATRFKEQQQTEALRVKNRIAWKNLFSPQKTGTMFTAVHLNERSSKLQTIYIDAHLATDFNITYERPNPFADADQITTFKTGTIKDQYGNLISDATLVNFVIKTQDSQLLQTSGATLNGVAQAQILHPNRAQNWEVQAFITGIAESNALTIAYAPALDAFPLEWDETKAVVKVGPLTGKLQQLLAEGTPVVLQLKSTKGTYTLEKKTQEGKVEFQLNTSFYKPGIYDLKVTVLGVSKTIEKINLY